MFWRCDGSEPQVELAVTTNDGFLSEETSGEIFANARRYLVTSDGVVLSTELMPAAPPTSAATEGR